MTRACLRHIGASGPRALSQGEIVSGVAEAAEVEKDMERDEVPQVLAMEGAEQCLEDVQGLAANLAAVHQGETLSALPTQVAAIRKGAHQRPVFADEVPPEWGVPAATEAENDLEHNEAPQVPVQGIAATMPGAHQGELLHEAQGVAMRIGDGGGGE